MILKPFSILKTILLTWLILELATFILLLATLGLGLTLLIGFATTAAGFILLGKSSKSTLEALQSSQGRGLTFALHAPSRILAAILLILPGFLSDIVGLALFIPQVGRLASGKIGTHFSKTEPEFVDLDASEWRRAEDSSRTPTKLIDRR